MKIKYSNLLVGLLLSLSYSTAADISLTPPNAKAGECYAKVMLSPKYETIEEKVMIKESSEEISIIPAKYETISKEIEVISSSKKLILVPATYKEVAELIEIKPSSRTWKTSLRKKALPVNKATLDAMKTQGVDLDSATVNTCFNEYFKAETYKLVSEDILIQNERNETEVIPATFDAQEESIEVLPASKKVVEIATEYEYVEEKILVEEAKIVWKKGQNPAQKLSGATGEIMCLVKVPAKYKTIKKKVVKNPAKTEIEEIAAQIQMIAVKKMAAEPTLKHTVIPAVYKTVEKKLFENELAFMWTNADTPVEAPWKKTGNEVCLLERAAVTKKIVKIVLDAPATVTEEVIPATFETVEIQKLVSEVKEVKTPIEAEYKMIQKRKKLVDTHLGWERILCQTNMNTNVIKQIQVALNEKSYDAGEADGILGKGTRSALEQYQKDNSLSTGGITYETLGSLNIEL